jgi:hypothetical protein
VFKKIFTQFSTHVRNPSQAIWPLVIITWMDRFLPRLDWCPD